MKITIIILATFILTVGLYVNRNNPVWFYYDLFIGLWSYFFAFKLL